MLLTSEKERTDYMSREKPAFPESAVPCILHFQDMQEQDVPYSSVHPAPFTGLSVLCLLTATCVVGRCEGRLDVRWDFKERVSFYFQNLHCRHSNRHIPVSLLCDVLLQQAHRAFDAVTAHWYFKGHSSCTAAFSVNVGWQHLSCKNKPKELLTNMANE